MGRRKTRRQPKHGLAWHQPTVLAGSLIVAMTLLAYAPMVLADFVWDDEDYVVNNVTLRSPEGLSRIWFDVGATRQYYPLVHTTFWIEYHLWKLAPLGYHVVNVLLHATGAVLLWRLLLRLRVPGAWLAAAIFAVHPVTVESVAWITERKNVLSLALALASILCYLRFEPADESDARAAPDSARRWWYALAFALFALALLSKTVVASVPAVLLVIFWWKRGRITWQSAAPLVPFFVLGISLGLLTVWMEKHTVGARGEDFDLTPLDRVLVAGRALWFYAAKLAWPHPLIFFYPRWTVDAAIWWQYLFPAAALAVVAGLWFARARIGRGPLAAVLIFAGVLVPALGFFDVYPFRFSYVADHFQYQGSTALLALAAAGGTLAAARLNPAYRRLAGFGAAILLAVLIVVTFRRTFVYRNLETFYRHIIARNTTIWLPYTNLAGHLNGLGQHDEALELSRRAVSLGSKEPVVQYNMGTLLLEQAKREDFRPGPLEEAIAHLNIASQLLPGFVAAHVNLGEALIAAQEPERASEHLHKALQLNPSFADAHFQLGSLAAKSNELPQAAQHYARAVRFRPEYFEAWNQLGATLLSMDRVDQSIRCFNRAIRLKPGDEQARANLHRALNARLRENER